MRRGRVVGLEKEVRWVVMGREVWVRGAFMVWRLGTDMGWFWDGYG